MTGARSRKSLRQHQSIRILSEGSRGLLKRCQRREPQRCPRHDMYNWGGIIFDSTINRAPSYIDDSFWLSVVHIGAEKSFCIFSCRIVNFVFPFTRAADTQPISKASVINNVSIVGVWAPRQPPAVDIADIANCLLRVQTV